MRRLVTAEPARAEMELGHSLATLQVAISELRHLVLELDPEVWLGQTIRFALDALAARRRRSPTLKFQLSIPHAADALPARRAIHALQPVREGLSNALSHAEAGQICV